VDDGVQHAVDGELALLQPDVRRSAAQLGALLHPDFEEIGSSGRRWSRAEIVQAMAGDLSLAGDEVSVTDLVGHRLSADVVHVRCTTTVAGRTSLRSSVWRCTEQGWQLWFHQGTPVPVGVIPTGADAPAGE
jgi:hypothetical protein